MKKINPNPVPEKENEMFNTDEWIEVKDAPIPNVDTLMIFIDAYRSPQAKLDGTEFNTRVRQLIERFLDHQKSQSFNEGYLKALGECLEIARESSFANDVAIQIFALKEKEELRKGKT